MWLFRLSISPAYPLLLQYTTTKEWPLIRRFASYYLFLVTSITVVIYALCTPLQQNIEYPFHPSTLISSIIPLNPRITQPLTLHKGEWYSHQSDSMVTIMRMGLCFQKCAVNRCLQFLYSNCNRDDSIHSFLIVWIIQLSPSQSPKHDSSYHLTANCLTNHKILR